MSSKQSHLQEQSQSLSEDPRSSYEAMPPHIDDLEEIPEERSRRRHCLLYYPEKSRESMTQAESLAFESGRLLDHERIWPRTQKYLREYGYMLRPRYKEGWHPSFGDKLLASESTDDSIILPLYEDRHFIIDATRLHDGRQVHIHRLHKSALAVQLLTLFSVPSMAKNKANPVVPVLDIFDDEYGIDFFYVVTPLLRPVDSPPFECVNDVVALIDRVLEGLHFLHAHGISYGQCTLETLSMDAATMFSQGFHPVKQHLAYDLTGPAWHIPRILCPRTVRYYFADLNACHIDPSMLDHARGLQVAADSGSMTPEVQAAFANDIFTLGKSLETAICDSYDNVQFVQPIVSSMTRASVVDRPTASQLLTQWRWRRWRIFPLRRLWRLRPRGEPLWVHIAVGIVDLGKLAVLSALIPFMRFSFIESIVQKIVSEV